ncbi:unnamed protein product (macronuclear) [Paramecium tetraurelia]|uniref:Uncharacterized protein n=1 Tax=Paramecium tetraurelia TaxID=5888 RepID=A0CK13_PARTE|nr:uncharacterized protein GSPATT00000842001 [Paramecium tetraurelia]CAK71130.1 unnamed protein product [Paramecium tetraurelia]|eukprot:XP_001438527.1 hypothetical protein (macronuclear) [Paramecium tetraurelia strain d4-2]
MESSLSKINNVAEKAMLELQKQPLITWNSGCLNTIRYILDKLKSCLEEVSFNLMTKDLNNEASLLQKLSANYAVVFDKVIEINSRKIVNAPELPIEYCQRQPNSTRSMLGGTEVQNFKIYSQKNSEFIDAEQTFKMNKQKIFRKMENKGTSTSDDAMIKLLQGNIQYETEKELLRIQEENEANLIDLRKQLKLKGLWSEICSSHATQKLNDLNKHMERETFKNDLYITDQIKQANEIKDEEEFDIRKEVKDKILLVQRKTADRIMRAAERKIRLEYDAFMIKRTAGILVKKSKTQNFQRIEELEKLIKDKNDQIVEKEAKMNQLFQKFEEQEKKFTSLLKQIDTYKVTQKVEVCNTIVSKNGKKSDVEVQVSMVDPRVELFELRLSEMIDENDEMKEELKLLHEKALEDKIQSLTGPKQIEEVLLLLLQSDLSPDNKIISLNTLLQYIKDNSAEDIARLAPNELYRIVRSKLKFNCESPLEKLDELSGDEDDSYEQQSQTKKRVKNNKKRVGHIEKPFEPSIQEQLDLDKIATQRRQAQSETEDESTKIQKKQLLQLNQIDDITKKTSVHKLIEQVSSPKSTNRSNITFKQKQGYLKTNRNNSAVNNDRNKKDQNSSSGQFGIQNSRPTLTQLETKSNKQSFSNFSSKELNIQKGEKQHKKPSIMDQSDIQCEFYKYNKTKDIGIQVSLKQESKIPPQQQHIETFIQQSQQQLKEKEKEKIEEQTKKLNDSQIYRAKAESISQKTTQTDDFVLWNLFQQMAGDLGLSEDQLKKLEAVFLNEQQFIHFYDKNSTQKQLSRNSSNQIDTMGDYRRDSYRNLDKSTGIRNSIKLRTGSQQNIFTNNDLVDNYVQQKNELGDDEQYKNQNTQPTSLYSPGVSRQQSQIIFSGNQNNYNGSINQPFSSNGIGNGQRTNSPINHNSSQGLRSVSQLINTGDNVHIITYGPVSPSEQMIRNKHRTSSSSQKLLEDMLKSKSQIAKSPEQNQREQKEQQLFFSVFGDEPQNDEEFDLEILRQNMGRPLEIIQDHLKEESIKKVFTQLAQREKNEWKDKIFLIISKYCNKSVQTITYFDFKKYYENYMRVHKRCGDECTHMKRFLARIGFGFVSKRKVLNMSKQSVSPFEQLPKLK